MSATTGTLTGTPTALVAHTTYTVTATNSGGSTTLSLVITVVEPPPASTRSYVDPTSGSFQLKRNAALSSSSHLVLDLVGPPTGAGAGVSITLSTDVAVVTWVDIPAGGTAATLVQNGTQFSLGAGVPLQKARATGNSLQVTLAQKAPTPAATLNGTLLRIALDLKAGLGLVSGTGIPLTVDQSKCMLLDGDGLIAPITVAAGTLTAQ